MPDVDEREIGRCVTCGYVGAIHVPLTTGIFEVLLGSRVAGDLWNLNGSPSKPWCLQEKPDFYSEVLALEKLPADERGLPTKQMLAKDRKCSAWLNYHQFSSPTQHRERALILELEEMRRQNDLKIAELQRQAAADTQQALQNQTKITMNIAEATRATESAMQTLADLTTQANQSASRIDTQNTRFNVLFAIFGVASFLGVVAALFWPDGVPDHANHDDSPLVIVTRTPTTTPRPLIATVDISTWPSRTPIADAITLPTPLR